MKCPFCGAEILSVNKVCSWCGSEIPQQTQQATQTQQLKQMQTTQQMRQVQQQLNKQGCPQCGSTNISFSREKQGELKGKHGSTVVHRTVGVCKDCGHTWFVQQPKPEKKKTWLWVLGWIFLFPLPLTILLCRKKDINNALKYSIIAVAWLIYLIFFFGSAFSKNDSGETKTSQTAESVEAEPAPKPEKADKGATEQDNNGKTEEPVVTETTGDSTADTLYADAEIIDLMSGSGKNKIGTMTVAHADQASCTEEALSDWYQNYVKKNSDSKFHVIVYDDVPGKGVYTNGMSFIQKDIALNKESDGTYSTGDDAGSTYYTVNEDGSLTVFGIMADETVINPVKTAVEAIIPAEYKGGHYVIDVAGEAGGKLDCNLTLVCDDFATMDLKAVAIDIGTNIKALDLNIGYLSFSFEGEDYHLYALGTLNDLSESDPSEISIDTF